MIRRALIGHGPTSAIRRAAYEDVLGTSQVNWLRADTCLSDDVVVDLEDSATLPTELRERLLASDAVVVSSAPLRLGAGRRILTAWPDLLSGPVAAMAADLGSLGRRSMTKAIVVTESPGIGPPVWQAVLALVALGGDLDRLAARRQPCGAGFESVYAVGRFSDNSIAYLEAVAGAPAGADLRFYEALGRGGIREYDSRLDINRVTSRGVATPLPATDIHPYARFVADLCRTDRPGPSAELASVLAKAHDAYRALLRACDSETAVAL